MLDPVPEERLRTKDGTEPGRYADVDEETPSAAFAGASVGVVGESEETDEDDEDAEGGVNGAVWFKAGSGWVAVIALVTQASKDLFPVVGALIAKTIPKLQWFA